MATEPEALRDWHRLFGLLLTDFFTDSPFVVEVERDLSLQQQLLDVVIVRRRPGRFAGRLPDGLEGLRAHNLITFKSHREALDDWAMKELIGHYVAYRKLVSRAPSELLPEDQFGLYAVAARFPQNLSARVPWESVRPGVYDCRWGTDTIRVVVAGELSQEEHNAPLHLFSARPALIEFGGRAYRPHRANASSMLLDLIHGFRAEGLAVPYTMDDYLRDTAERRSREIAETLRVMSPERRERVIQSIPLEERLAGVTPEQIQEYLARQPAPPRKPRRKK